MSTCSPVRLLSQSARVLEALQRGYLVAGWAAKGYLCLVRKKITTNRNFRPPQTWRRPSGAVLKISKKVNYRKAFCDTSSPDLRQRTTCHNRPLLTLHTTPKVSACILHFCSHHHGFQARTSSSSSLPLRFHLCNH